MDGHACFVTSYLSSGIGESTKMCFSLCLKMKWLCVFHGIIWLIDRLTIRKKQLVKSKYTQKKWKKSYINMSVQSINCILMSPRNIHDEHPMTMYCTHCHLGDCVSLAELSALAAHIFSNWWKCFLNLLMFCLLACIFFTIHCICTFSSLAFH